MSGFSRAVAELRPELEAASMTKPLTMLLFGMIHWMFTWMRSDGDLPCEDMALVVSELFFGGLPAVMSGSPDSRDLPRPLSTASTISDLQRPPANERRSSWLPPQ